MATGCDLQLLITISVYLLISLSGGRNIVHVIHTAVSIHLIRHIMENMIPFFYP
jgi:hypothetical protein